MFFRKKKAPAGPPTYPYGFAIPQQPETVCSQKGLVCLMKGLLIFAASYGTVSALISSFDLPCYQTPLMLLMLLLSVLLAFLHYSRLLFNLFYPVIFVSFTYFIFTFRFMVNSGYQAFVNILQQTYGDYYALDTYRQSQEYFSDRAMTITYAASFIGFFLILLLNIFISEYMSLVAVIALTFPLFQIGIYVERMPSMSSFVLILFSYFMVGILRSSRHFLLPYRDKKWTEFKYREQGDQVTYRYHASGKLFWQLTVLFFCFTLGIGILTLPMLGSSTNSRLSSSRRSLDEYMQVFTQNGLSGFFDRYSAKGGISGGQLGGVSSVRPDYQTDLNLTFVPYSYDSLYLKAYTGSDYTGDAWQPAFVEKESPAVLTDQTLASLPKATMRVENLDAETGYLYLPYYVGTDIGMSYIPLADGFYPEGDGCPDQYDCLYHPTGKSAARLLEESGDETVHLKDSDAYMAIPQELSNYLETLHSDIGREADPLLQADRIYAFLRDNYPYSQTPGITPEYEDFVKYFLETQKRGYCSHFASAGVMLMRSFGYPARYCEGYCVSLSDVSEGSELTEEKYEDWYEGDNALGKTGVVSVPVTDGSAHAWAEIFVEGLGWVPYEFTPPSDETDLSESYSGFWEIFSGLFALSGDEPDASNVDNDAASRLSDNTKKLTGFLSSSVFRPLFFVLALLLSALLIYQLIHIIRIHGSMLLAYRRGEHKTLIAYHYRLLTAKLSRKKHLTDSQDFLLPSDLPALHERLLLSDAFRRPAALKDLSIEQWGELLTSCLFSEKGITGKQADALLSFIKAYKKALR